MATVKITGLTEDEAEAVATWLAIWGLQGLEDWLEDEGHRDIRFSAPINYGASPNEIEVIARHSPPPTLTTD